MLIYKKKQFARLELILKNLDYTPLVQQNKYMNAPNNQSFQQ